MTLLQPVQDSLAEVREMGFATDILDHIDTLEITVKRAQETVRGLSESNCYRHDLLCRLEAIEKHVEGLIESTGVCFADLLADDEEECE